MRQAVRATTVAIGLLLAAGSAAQVPPPRTTPTALDFMVEAVETICRPEGDKLETARQLISRGWRLTDTADHYDKDFGVDAPVPLQNRHERGWRGPLTDGRASLSISTTDYRDPARRDHFSARFMASPETAIDIDDLQLRLGMTLRPLRPPHVGRSTSYSVIVIDGQPGPTVPAQFGQMQHFRLEPAPAGIEIEATRTWGAGFPEQWLRISCSTRFDSSAN